MKFKNQLISVIFIFSLQSFADVKNVAHRGGALLAPENSISSFKNAIVLKADFLELDILISSDDSLMIMHDETVDRTTNGNGLLSELTYSQLRKLDAGSKFKKKYANEKIPTFSEILEIANKNKIEVVAEIKSTDSTAVKKVVAMVQNYKMQDRVILSSFNIDQIKEVRRLDSTIRIQLFATVNKEIIDQLKEINAEWIGSNEFSQEIIDYAHSKNLLFNVWTVNKESEMISLIKLGVDAITTDDPATLKKLTSSKKNK